MVKFYWVQASEEGRVYIYVYICLPVPMAARSKA